MALQRKTKIWITVISAPFALIILAAIGLKLYLTGDRLKTLVIPKIEQSIHRTVHVGDISLSIFPSFSVSIERLAISNPEGMEFGRGSFLTLGEARLKVNILQLINDKLDISYVILDRPVIYLEVREDGTDNYSMEEPSVPEKESVAGNELKNPGAFLLSNFEMKNGEIEYVNKKSDIHLLFTGYDQTMQMESPHESTVIRIEGKSSADKVSYGSLSRWFIKDLPLAGSVKFTYDTEKDLFTLEDVSASLKELRLTARGSISDFRQEKMIFDIYVATPGVGMPQLLSLTPPELLRAASGLTSSGNVTFSMRIAGSLSEMSTPGVTGSFAVSDGKIQYASLPKSITNVNLSGSFERPEVRASEKAAGKFRIEKLTAKLGNNEIAGKLKVTDFEDPTVSAAFVGSVSLAEVKEYYPLDPGTELGGAVKADILLEGKVNVPQSINANGKMELLNVTVSNAGSPKPLRDLNGIIKINNQLIESKQLGMNIGESDLKLSFVLKNYLSMLTDKSLKSEEKPSVSLSLSSAQLRISDLTGEEKSGKGESGKGERRETGLLPGFDVAADVNIGRLVTEKFKFNNARGSVRIANGIIDLTNFSVNGFGGTILTKGKIDLRDAARRPFNLDLDIVGVESNSILSNFTTFGKNIYGKFSMNTKLSGDLNDTLGIDTKTLGGAGKVQIFDGKLIGFALTGAIADYSGLQELREVNFKNWTNSFSISDGRVNITDLKVGSSSADFIINGSHGLDGSMAYALTAKLPASVSDRVKLAGVGNELIQYFKDKEGRINLNFDVGGTTGSPKLKLNTKAQEEAAKQKLLEKGKKKVEDALKNLFKKP